MNAAAIIEDLTGKLERKTEALKKAKVKDIAEAAAQRVGIGLSSMAGVMLPYALEGLLAEPSDPHVYIPGTKVEVLIPVALIIDGAGAFNLFGAASPYVLAASGAMGGVKAGEGIRDALWKARGKK